MNKKNIFTLFIFFLYIFSFAQENKDSLYINLNFKWKSDIFELNKNYVSKNDTLQINVLKFYISGIEIVHENGFVCKEKNSYHLVDFENKNSNKIVVSNNKNTTISKIIFNIGIDSTASVSGALQGDLDLQNGMYWAWQSGYINMKIEGKSKSCKTRNNIFQYHIGGYLQPNYTLRKIEIHVKNSNINKIDLVMNLSKLFDQINLSETNSIMIPGEKANILADKIQQIFTTE